MPTNPVAIPRCFQLFGQVIKVKEVPDLSNQTGRMGQADLYNNQIMLQANTEGMSVNASQMQRIFFHELMHMCFELLHKYELSEDEQLVDNLASLLHQAFVTAEYEDYK